MMLRVRLMPKEARTTVTLEEDDLPRRQDQRRHRTGKRDSQVIEESLRRDLGLEGLEDHLGASRPRSPEDHGLRPRRR